MQKCKWNFIWAGLILILPLTGCVDNAPSPSSPQAGTFTNQQSRLDTVLKRGKLICGVSGELPGFSFVESDGKYSGLDVDVCRSIAAALFDNPNAVEFRKLSAKQRFPAVQSGEVDVLSRNTTQTIQRDTELNLDFAPVVFYDGQGLMVRQDGNLKTLESLKNRSICVQSGTTTEQNLADQMRKRNIPYTSVVFDDVNITFGAYTEGRCDAITADRSALVSRRSSFLKPDDHVILTDLLSKEPLAPAVSSGDPRWSDVVKWTVYTLIDAEELGINSQNVAQFATSTDPVVKRFLGGEGDFGKKMGIPNDFAARIVKHVGNYGEVYDRNLGAKTKLKLDRGLNNLWNKGGILYSPPFR